MGYRAALAELERQAPSAAAASSDNPTPTSKSGKASQTRKKPNGGGECGAACVANSALAVNYFPCSVNANIISV
jgi:hypothetical protein